MAYFLKNEGKEYGYLLDKGYEMKHKFQTARVHEYSENSDILSGLEVLAADTSCKECRKLNGKVISIEQAEHNAIIPIKDCTFEPYGCRCTYIPVV